MSLPKPYYETELGVLYNVDCLSVLPYIEPVDLVLTSPPYDNLRKYNGYVFDFKKTAKLIKNILSIGAVCVWVVSDETVNGSETGTSFKQALYFKYIGLNLHDTMFYEKDPMPLTHNRYEQAVEYMFVFSNGSPKTFNPIKEKCSQFGKKLSGNHRHDLNKLEPIHGLGNKTKQTKIKNNFWKYYTGFNKSTKDKIAFDHPAIFPELLAHDHIYSWTNENEIVLDCFSGSGTTAKQCERLKRRWIGIEIEEKYCEIAAKRIEAERKQLKLF